MQTEFGLFIGKTHKFCNTNHLMNALGEEEVLSWTFLLSLDASILSTQECQESLYSLTACLRKVFMQ